MLLIINPHQRLLILSVTEPSFLSLILNKVKVSQVDLLLFNKGHRCRSEQVCAGLSTLKATVLIGMAEKVSWFITKRGNVQQLF